MFQRGFQVIIANLCFSTGAYKDKHIKSNRQNLWPALPAKSWGRDSQEKHEIFAVLQGTKEANRVQGWVVMSYRIGKHPNRAQG